MTEFLIENYELEPFLLRSVQLTGIRIGAGAYGSVEEVAVHGAVCAAKKIHDFFLDTAQVPSAAISKVSAKFVRECRLNITLRHPHIVQFLGVCFLPGSRLPALVMERLLTSLHDLLDPETDPPPPHDAPKPFFPLGLKCSILHDVACGLAYLHERSPAVIHRDLSARNVLLNSGMVAKIADLGVARIVPRVRVAATMTKAPGAGVYMPPEALEDKPDYDDIDDVEKEAKAKYDASIDVFSFGVVAIFTLSQTFPCKLLAPTFNRDGQLLARTELQRRDRYMRIIFTQLHDKHPLVNMIKACLDFPENRPLIQDIFPILEQAKIEFRDNKAEMNKLELLQALQVHPKYQEMAKLQHALQCNERERQVVTEQLSILQQQMEKLKQQESEILRLKETEIVQLQQQLKEKELKLRISETQITELSHQSESAQSIVSRFHKLKTSSSSQQVTLGASEEGIAIAIYMSITIKCVCVYTYASCINK